MAPSTKTLAFVSLASLASAAPWFKAVKRDTCTSPVQRKNFTSLSNDEKTSYLDAVKCMMNTEAQFNIYDGAQTLWEEQQYAHLVQSNFIHGVGAFLPWHRYFMTLHETLLSTYCNYTSGVPYWDEAIDATNITQSAVWDATHGIGGDGNASADQCVTDGPFANTTLHVGAESSNTVIPKTAEYCLNRTISTTIFAAASQANIDTCMAEQTWEDFYNCLGSSPHSAGHAGTGGTMQDAVLSPGDPVFFLHHTNLDRLWWEWQQANASARLTEMGGSNTPSEEFNRVNSWEAPGANFTDYDGDEGNVTTLSHVLWMLGMIQNVTIADVMDIGNATVCAEYV